MNSRMGGASVKLALETTAEMTRSPPLDPELPRETSSLSDMAVSYLRRGAVLWSTILPVAAVVYGVLSPYAARRS